MSHLERISAIVVAISVAALGSSVLPAQNEVFHHDGTTEATWRGALTPTAPKTILQRLPGDQIAGRTGVVSMVAHLQDQDETTPQTFEYKIRRNDPFMPGTPNMGVALGTTVLTVDFPAGPGGGLVSALSMELVFPMPVALCWGFTCPLPAGGAFITPGVPYDDIYSAISLYPAPAWPADGLSCHVSGMLLGAVGEQMSPGGLGYAGVVGSAGLGWEADPTVFVVAPTPLNASWRIATRLVDDVVQPFAVNAGAFLGAGGTGADPNFGYAGLWPDMFRPTGPDAIGIRLRATAPVGTPAVLGVSTGAMLAMVTIPGITGSLGLDPALTFVLPATATVAAPADQPATTSEAFFGPFPGGPGLAGLTAYVQGVTLPPAGLVFTTMARVSF